MNFLSDFWANMGQKEETVDLTGDTDQLFQLVVPRRARSRSLTRAIVSKWMILVVRLTNSLARVSYLLFFWLYLWFPFPVSAFNFLEGFAFVPLTLYISFF